MSEPYQFTDEQASSPSESDTLSKTAASRDQLIGQTFAGKYLIDRILGTGGFGKVYHAQHSALGSEVAIKVIHKYLCRDPKQLKRFEQEALLLSRLESPQIIRVLDYGLTPTPFMIMEYFSGSSLSDLKRSLSEAEAITLFKNLCAGLSAAHSIGLVHRDLKPSNIMTSLPEKPLEGSKPQQLQLDTKILDFGLAKLVDAEETGAALTVTGELLGSPPYIAPEQWLGQTIDSRCDIYSLGCIMYEVLAGRPVYVSDTVQAYLQMHVKEQPKPFSEVKKKARGSADLEKVVMKCLLKDPKQRYQSCSEILSDLKKIEAGKKLKIRLPVCGVAASILVPIGLVAGLYMQRIQIADNGCAWFNEQADRQSLQGKPKEAMENFRHSLSLSVFLPDQDKFKLHAMRSLAALLEKSGAMKEARALRGDISKLIIENPWPEVQALLADCAYQRNHKKDWLKARQLAATATKVAAQRGKSMVYSDCLSTNVEITNECINRNLCSKNYDQLIAQQEASLQVASDLLDSNDQRIAGRLFVLGQFLTAVNRPADSFNVIEQAISISRNNNNLKAVANMSNELGVIYFRQKDYEHALAAFKESFDIRKQSKNSNVRDTAYNNFGAVYAKLGNLKEALAIMTEGLKADEKAGVIPSQVLLRDIGDVYNRMRDYANAELFYERALHELERLKLTDANGSQHWSPAYPEILGSLAAAKEQLGKTGEATAMKEHLQKLNANQEQKAADKVKIPTQKSEEKSSPAAPPSGRL